MSADFRPAPPSDRALAQEEINRQRLASYWTALGEPPHYPCDSSTVCRLLQQAEYRCDPDWLLSAVDGGMIPPPPRVKGRLSWDATSIIFLACAAEVRGRWQPSSQIHGHKRSQLEKDLDEEKADAVQAVSQMARFDFEALVALLHREVNNADGIHLLASAIREKLKLAGAM
jgi:hypothetical protein